MKPDLQISIKDYRRPPSLRFGATRNIKLEILLTALLRQGVSLRVRRNFRMAELAGCIVLEFLHPISDFCLASASNHA